MTFKKVRQQDLSAECWNVQVWGFDACNTCELLNTPDCGGQNIRRTGENSKGIPIPINSVE